MRKVTVEFNDEDVGFVVKFDEAVRELAYMVWEMMVNNPGTVLSPIFRSMLAEKAKQAESMRAAVGMRLYVDNPGKPLNAKEVKF